MRGVSLASSVTAALVLLAGEAQAETYFVALDGSDETGTGSSDAPWRTLDYAVDSGIPATGGDEVVVRDGTYSGMTTITRGFPSRVTVRAENPYGVVLTNADGGAEALRIYVEGSANLTVEGFIITNHHPSYTCPSGREAYYLVHIQDASDVTLRNNVIYGNNAPGTCNELLKINRGSEEFYPRNIVVQGNLFYDSANAGGADMIDSVRPGEIDVVENVFVGDPAHGSSQSFITLKRQVPTESARSPRFVIARNVFLNWSGATDQAFVQLGEDGDAEVMISDALIENNLFIGNSPAQQAAPVQLKGAADITIRANTVVGDLPSGAFVARIGTEGDNPPVAGYEVRNNIFCDPTGTMGDRLVNAYGLVDVASILLDHNLYWNGGAALPSGGSVPATDDLARVEADPLLATDQSGLVLPLWDGGSGRFGGGGETIRDEFLRLVESYGALAEGSPAVGAADAADMPAVDIRGLARGEAPDLGAYELGAAIAPDGDADSDSDGDGDGDGDADSDGDGDGDGDGDSDGDVDGDDDADVDDGAGHDEGGCSCSAPGRSGFVSRLLDLFVRGVVA